jgi:uncharacterized protein YciI
MHHAGMRIRFYSLLAFASLAFSCSREAAPPTDASREEQAQPSPPASAALPAFELVDYQFGLLRKGPTHGTGTKAEIEKMQAGHMANIEKMARSGKLMAAGPMGDDGNLRGIFLFNASAAEAQALAAEDPSIQAGRLVLELHAWHGPKDIGAKLNEEYRKDPHIKMTMTEYFLVLLTKGPKAEEGSAVEQEKLQRDHLWNVRRMLDAKTFVAAGPFDGTGDVRGIFVIAAKTLEEARAIADADPAVKAGQLAVELHPWWVAKEVWPG